MAPTIGVNLRVTGHCNQGSRKHMEDMFSVAYQQTEDELDLEYAYFGIFDGHGGHEAATFAKEHLMKAIVSQSGFWSDNDKDVLRAIKEGFIATHYAMWRNLENWPKTQSGWPSTSGTTASVAFIRRSNIYIGHVGDSCIVLGYQDPSSDCWSGAPLTMDHKPENPIEYDRISQAGGMVVQKSGVPRVVWHRPHISHKGPLTRSTHIDQIPFLAVARSLGDLWSYNPDSDRFVVSPEPDVSVHHIDLSRDRCLIFGTDGLWNMLSPEEAVSIVKKAESNNKNGGIDGQDHTWLNPSKCLVDNALSKWMSSKLRADNTSAVTLLLDPLGPPHSQVLDQQNSASQTQSEFVPYHIESYKINEGKSPSKFPHQSNGLAICTWYPHKSNSENINKNDGLTTLSTMEELFGEKVEIINSSKKERNEGPLQAAKKNVQGDSVKSNVETLEPSTSKIYHHAELPVHLKKIPLNYSTILRNANRSYSNHAKYSSASEKEGEMISKQLKAVGSKIITDNDISEQSKIDSFLLSKENDNISHSHSEENNRMKLRGSLVSKGSDRANSEGLSKNSQKTNFHLKSMKRNGKRGKKRKGYEIIKSDFNVLNSKRLKPKGKRRHSSLLETMNIIYEPRPKRRTRSEDQRKNYDTDDYKSDTENKLEEELNKVRRINSKLKVNVSHEAHVEIPETSEDNIKQNHLQERLHSSNNNNNSNSSINNTVNINNNNNSNSHNNSNGNDSSVNNTNNNINNNSSQDFTPMRLRSNMPVKTLRSRNINLENCDWFVFGLSKINVNPIRKSLSKQNCKSEETSELVNKSLSKVSNVISRTSLNSTKLQINESTHRSTVHTRSQNKRLRK